MAAAMLAAAAAHERRLNEAPRAVDRVARVVLAAIVVPILVGVAVAHLLGDAQDAMHHLVERSILGRRPEVLAEQRERVRVDAHDVAASPFPAALIAAPTSA